MLRLWLVVMLLVSQVAHAAPPRPQEMPERKTVREPEPSPPSTRRLDVAEEPLFVDLTQVTEGCSVRGYGRLRKRLLGLENASQYMSLEVWGDMQDYGPYQKVLFHLRVPRGSYVTLYWIGPEGYITVPIENARIPPERDVTLDTGGIIVPPYGNEQWVAIATLEPMPLGCLAEGVMLAALERRLKAVHGVGRWSVQSSELPAKSSELPGK